jgi:hypothetical protein
MIDARSYILVGIVSYMIDELAIRGVKVISCHIQGYMPPTQWASFIAIQSILLGLVWKPHYSKGFPFSQGKIVHFPIGK